MIKLIRNNSADDFGEKDSIHPALLLQKGIAELAKQGEQPSDSQDTKKSAHIQQVCQLKASDLYQHAFRRWCVLSSNDHQSHGFGQTAMTLQNRMFIGLSAAAGALETGCSLNHNYGMPYIPGSAVKGIVRAWAYQHSSSQKETIRQLLGDDDTDNPQPISGLVSFYDAWWIPENDLHPFAAEIVTSHHQEYYSGKSPQRQASDKDDPVPNAMVAVKGSFLFVLKGQKDHREICQRILKQALREDGIGARTASGYGYMDESRDADKVVEDIISKAGISNCYLPALAGWNPGSQELSIQFIDNKTLSRIFIRAERARKLLENLPKKLLGSDDIKSGRLQVEVKVLSTGQSYEVIEMRKMNNAQ